MGRRTLSRQWFTAAEIAAMRLPGMPTTKSAVIRVAKREG
jgi:putative transposase